MVSAATVSPIKPVIAEDDGVRERHGCTISASSNLAVFEDGTRVTVRVNVYSSYWASLDADLTPARARYIARKLYRLARRIERRELVK